MFNFWNHNDVNRQSRLTFAQRRRQIEVQHARRRFLGCELLEDRRLLASYSFFDTVADINLSVPLVGSVAFTLQGQSHVDVTFEGADGQANDDTGGNNLDEVQTEITSLNLAGPVGVILRAGAPSMGQLEEQVDLTTGTLDVAPYGGLGAADSFFDVYVEVDPRETLDPSPGPLHNNDPLHLQSVVTYTPTGKDEVLVLTVPVELYTEGGFATGIFIDSLDVTLDPTLASIQGQKWLDYNADGSKNRGEPGLNNWVVVALDPFNGDPLAAAVTHSEDLNGDGRINPETEQGLYTLTGLPPRQYLITELMQPDWAQTAPGFEPVTVHSELGPGQHWFDNFPGYQDESIDIYALATFDWNLDGVADEEVFLDGNLKVVIGPAVESDPTGDPGHFDLSPAEVYGFDVSGFSTQGLISMQAGDGNGDLNNSGPLATLGGFQERAGDPFFVDSFFDVFFNVDVPALGGSLSNSSAIRVDGVSERFPLDGHPFFSQNSAPLLDGGATPQATLLDIRFALQDPNANLPPSYLIDVAPGAAWQGINFANFTTLGYEPPVIATDGNWEMRVNPLPYPGMGVPVGMNYWANSIGVADDAALDHMGQQWFWYSIDGGPEQPLDTLTLVDASVVGNIVSLTYGDATAGDLLQALITYQLNDVNDRESILHEEVTLQSLGDPIDVQWFEYSDLDVDANFGGAHDTAALITNGIGQTGSLGSTVDTTVVSGTAPNHFQISPLSDILDSLNDGSATMLDDTDHLAGQPANVTHAFQWSVSQLDGTPLVLYGKEKHILASEVVLPNPGGDGSSGGGGLGGNGGGYLPGQDGAGGGADGSVDFFGPDAPVVDPRWLDPAIAIGYDYVATVNAFASVTLPPGFGDNSYTLHLDDGAGGFNVAADAVLTGGVAYDFTTVNPAGVTSFRILGIEPAAGVDPADPVGFPTGLTFVDANSFAITQTGIPEIVYVDAYGGYLEEVDFGGTPGVVENTDMVTWLFGSSQAVAGLIFGVTAFDSVAAAQAAIDAHGYNGITQIEEAPYDFGDAPDPTFPTLLASSGARHAIDPTFYLGATIDAEVEGQPDKYALGDDLDGNNDDDGVSFVGRPEFPGVMGTITVTVTDTVGGGGFLDAWIDFNNNGTWEAGEQIAVSLPVVAGPNPVTFTNPVDAMTGYVMSRFRLSREGGLAPDGPASNGEVEDYALLIKSEPMDFGDAPLPYPTYSGYIGAIHTIAGGLFLGASVDSELDGQPNATATGDDINLIFAGTAYPPGDEDGVVFTSPLIPGNTANVDITASAAGLLDAWVDFNNDSVWAAGEQIFTSTALSAGVNSLSFAVPGGTTLGLQTFARFRVSSAGGLDPLGYAADGEVEDHAATICSLLVTNSDDSGPGSLRDAILCANGLAGADVITFDTTGVFATPQTITLGGTELPTITDAVTITGTGAANLTIDANHLSRIFNINDGNNLNQFPVEIVAMTLTGGNVSGGGGAIFTRENLTLSDSIISGNSALVGGGIYSHTPEGGTTTIQNSTVSGNSAGQGGGIKFINFGTTTLQNSTVSGNSAGNFGGGIYLRNNDGTTTIQNSTLSGNSASWGGGIDTYLYNGSAKIASSIVAGNSATTYAPDIRRRSFTGAMTVTNSLVGDNTGLGLAEAQTPDTSGNFVGDPAGVGIINPLLGPLADNGGTTPTMALLAGSLAINSGANPAGLTFDQRGTGFPRVLVNRADIGAYELDFTPTESLIVTTMVDEDNGTSDPSVGTGTSLREAMAYANSHAGTDTITFDTTGVFASPQTIILNGTELPTISDAVTITGTGAANLTIDAAGGSRIFNIDDGNAGNSVSVELVAMTLTGGLASGSFPANTGGAISSWESLTLRDSIVTGNSATFVGGGVYSIMQSGGTTTIQNSTLSGNTAAVAGGGVYSIMQRGGTTTIQNSTLSGNTADLGGGLFANSYGTTTIQNSTLSGNTATQRGGGVFSITGDGGATTIQNSTISGNSASIGGGIYYINHETAYLTSSIVAGNAASDLQRQTGSTLTVIFSLIGDNTGSVLPESSTPDPTTHNVVGGSVGGIIDAILGPLADNGGPTQTMALLAGSPALNLGSNPASLTTDQRGYPFVRSFGAGVDMGAYEAQSLALVVDIDNDVDNGNYAPGDLSLREAVRLANENPGLDAITFGNGAPLGGTDFTDANPDTIVLAGTELAITDAVTITGTGATNLTIDADGNSRIFFINDDDSDNNIDVELVGLTLTGGQASGAFPADAGGAIWSSESLTVRDSEITGNTAYFGGGIAAYTGYGGTTTIQNSTLSGNNANYGGGIYADTAAGGTTTIQSSTLSGNVVNDKGGGLHAFNYGTLTIQDSTVSGNLADSLGGGIYARTESYGTTTILNSTVSGNDAYYGGGIASATNNYGATTIQYSTVSGNTASFGGGIASYTNNYGTSTIQNSTVSGNMAYGSYSSRGGGIASYTGNYGTTIIQNSTISGNYAYANGGGIYAQNYGSTTIQNSTISGNTAYDGSGGGIYSYEDGVATTIESSIVAGNTASYAADLYVGANPVVVTFSLIGDNTGSGLDEVPVGTIDPTGNYNFVGDPDGDGIIDPRLGPLADNGGPTQTMALLSDSPALDAGIDAVALGIDQRGVTRPFDMTTISIPDSDGSDMGAFELVGGSIHGQKFEDLNGNGQRDPGEPGVNDFTIELYDASGTELLASTTTMDMELDGVPGIDPLTESGVYWLPGLPPGDYVIREQLSSGFVQTYPAALGSTEYLVTVFSDQQTGTTPAEAQIVCGPGLHWVDDCGTPTIDSFFDVFFSVANLELQGDITSPLGAFTETVFMSGNTQVARSEPRVSGTPAHFDTIDTEMVAMDLTGDSPFGAIRLRAGTEAGLLQPTIGLVQEQAGDPFAADSFFDVFFEIDTPLGTLHNNVPLHVSAVIGQVTPYFVDFVGQNPVELFDPLNEPTGISVTQVTHTPTYGPDFGNTVPGSIHGFKFEDMDGDGVYTPPMCVAPDDGTGTVDGPGSACPYVNDTGELVQIIDGLPPGDTIDAQTRLHSFTVTTAEQPGGTLGGTRQVFDGTLTLDMLGTGSLVGFTRTIDIPVSVTVDTAPRTPGDPVQTFSTEMFVLAGQILAGDPDFDLLQITAGSSFALPSPGQTTLTQLPGGDFNVDSFFDITYQIDFVGAPGGTLAGLSGSTTGTFRVVDEPTAIDLPLAGVEVTLSGTDGMGNVIDQSITTGATGEFWFTGLLPSINGVGPATGYTLTETVPAGFVATTDTSYHSDLFSRDELVAFAGQAMLDPMDPRVEIVIGEPLMFGNTVPGSIHGFKFVDHNANGVYDDLIDEPLANVTFTLTGTDGQGTVVNQPINTNASGEFWFTDLLPSVAGIGPGTGYTVTETVPSGYVATTPTSYTSDLLSRQEMVAFEGQAMLPPPAYTESQKLLNSDGAAADLFGESVAIDGNFVVVGAHGQGAAYVYELQAGSWTEVAKLTASDGEADDFFGRSVSISGDTIVVGADRDDVNDTDSGSAYVFVRPTTGWTTTSNFTAKLSASDGAAQDYFGFSVSINGDTVVVGAYSDDDLGADSGSAYVYVRPGAGWTTTSNSDAKLTPGDGGGWFGRSVSVSGDTVAIGAYADDDNGLLSGSAYVYVQPPAGWASTSSFDAKLTPSDGAADDNFGYSVSLSGDTVAIGAPGDNDKGGDSGSTYVYVRPDTGWATTTSFTAKLIASDGALDDNFGHSVSIDGGTIVIGAFRDDLMGSAYVYQRPGTAWATTSSFNVKLTASDRAIGDEFGTSVSISGDAIVIGASMDDDNGSRSGSAYIYSAVYGPRLEVLVGAPLMFGNAEVDLGDAPDPLASTAGQYPTLLANNGARHVVGGGLFLGASVDPELEGQPNATATGDDVNLVYPGVAFPPGDEDGVIFTSLFIPGNMTTVTVNASGTGKLDAWVDFNADGDWADTGEQIFTSEALASGNNFLSFAVPAGATLGAQTFARFRVSSAGGLPPTGLAADGEVEDYLVETCGTTVTNTNNDGLGSLHVAILCSNGATGTQTIDFDIAGVGPHTITPLSALPTITDAVIIDGTTEPDFAGTPVIELDGSSAGAGTNGLRINAGGSTVRGLVINRFSAAGIRLETGGGNTVAGNYIGTDVSGTADLGNAAEGVIIYSSPSNTIGGTVAADRNVISGNTRFGVEIDYAASTGNLVQGNYIGTDVNGTAALGNTLDGVLIYAAPSNTIGGTAAGAGNVISGNQRHGIYLTAGAANNLVQGNLVGTDKNGTADLGNTQNGVLVNGAPSNTIGGTAMGARNVISGNNQNGVSFSGAAATSNLVQGNYIGTDFTGTADLGNTLDGVLVSSAPGNTIGGTTVEARNVISGNNRYGVEIDYTAATGNLVQGNFIGTDGNGTAALGNTLDGVLIYNAPSNTIGGTAAGAGNVISGNQRHGMYLLGAATTGNLVQGNLVGTDINGTADLGNTQDGVLVSSAPNNTIGGTTESARNVISGNNRFGVEIVNSAATGNLVQGNFIGTDVNGTAAVGNTFDGVLIYDAPSNTIGGTAAGAGNLISGNQQHGVELFGPSAQGNLVQGNLVGTDINGTAALGNIKNGVLVLYSGVNNTIGGTAMGSRNVISGNHQNGVYLLGADGTSVQGNYIGTDTSGNLPLANSLSGVVMQATKSITIGGTAAGAGNVISGNTEYGVYLLGAGATGNFVQGNSIGTNGAGTGAVANGFSGVGAYNAPSNTIGGTVAGARNVISGNNQNGVYLSGSNASSNLVQGNYIGTDITGTADLGNTQDGVLVSSAPNNTIGGTTVEARNVISGNNRFGVEIDYAAATGNLVQGNYIGTDVNGTAAVGNTLDGVLIYNAPSNTIGGTAVGAGNVISGNQRHGVDLLGTGTGNAILHNSISSNTGLGIDLNGDGVTANDVDDPDTGPNKLQNFPVMTSVLLNGANLDITYAIPSIAPNSTFPLRVEFFIADAANQEGQTFLDSDSYTTTGSKMVTIAAGSAVLGTKIVATATDNGGTGNTSEFSANATVASSLLAAGGAAPVGIPAASLTSAQLQPIVAAAISRLVVQGLTAAQANQLSSVQVGIADLPGATLGLAAPHTIMLDANAAGYGWFVDATPGDDAEFSIGSRLSTRDSQLRMDLLTAVMHELGHTLGRDDLHDHGTEDDLMYEALAAGVRRTSFAAGVDAVWAGE